MINPKYIAELIPENTEMKKETFRLSGMSCGHCVKSVEEALRALPVEKFDVKINLAEILYDESKVTHKQIAEAIEEEGYTVLEEELSNN
jgi:copper chaperone